MMIQKPPTIRGALCQNLIVSEHYQFPGLETAESRPGLQATLGEPSGLVVLSQQAEARKNA
jgi:hypothetical protein